MGGNPQYLLDVNSTTDSTMWIVLSRHITEKADFANNRDFITLLVYELSTVMKGLQYFIECGIHTILQ